jgi:hypothetical protein
VEQLLQSTSAFSQLSQLPPPPQLLPRAGLMETITGIQAR